MDSRQIAEWMAYFSVEPFGEYAAYWRAGVIAATTANVHRGKRGRTFKPEDFMPKETARTGTQSVEEMAEVLRRTFRHAKRHGLAAREQT